jgi:hypothetical protein
MECASCGRRFQAERRSAITCSDACRQARARLLRATTPPLPEDEFDLLVADPPLGYRTWSAKGQGRSPGQHYQTMDLAALCRLPIGTLAARNAGLALWGFHYKSELLFWLKVDKDGKPFMGTGHTSRKTNEQMLYAIKGKGLMVLEACARGFSRREADTAKSRTSRWNHWNGYSGRCAGLSCLPASSVLAGRAGAINRMASCAAVEHAHKRNRPPRRARWPARSVSI